MRNFMDFEGFLKEGIAKRQGVNKPRAEFMVKESENDYNYLLELIKKLGIREDNANDYVKRCYDLLMSLIRAKMLLDGYGTWGLGAHEAEVAYMSRIGFQEREIAFADQMRYFRNGILYYGTALDKTYAEKVIAFTREIYPRLKRLVGLSSG